MLAASAVLGLLPGCAQVISRSSVEVIPRTDAATLVVGPPGGEITAREVGAGWSQDGDRLTVRLEESRTCNSARHVPVVRIERVDKRTARGAMWFEYGFGAAAFAGGLTGLIRPEWFSQAKVVNAEGQQLEDKRTGYRIGGILTGIGSLLLVAAVIDTVRTRDEVRYADAYRREEGSVVKCMDPLAPMSGQTVELLVGQWSSVEGTDDGGGARFLLPGVEDLPEDARKVIAATTAWDAAKAELDAATRKAEEEAAARAAEDAAAAAKKKRKGKAARTPGAAGDGSLAAAAKGLDVPIVPAVELGPRPEPIVVRGVLRLDNKRALAVSFVVPYADEKAKGYEGHGGLEAATGVGGGPAPGKGKAVSLEGEGTREGDAAASGDGDDAKAGDAKAPADAKAPDASKTGAGKTDPGEGSGASKSGEPSLKLGGSGSSGSGSGSGKKSESSLTLGGGSRSGTKGTGTGASKTDEAR